MSRYLLTLEYDGARYQGWQYQENKPTIEGAIEDAIERVTHERVTVNGSGRTDSGVHAIAQTAHFDLEKDIDPFKMTRSLNFYLPSDIAVKSVERVDDTFHARYDVVEKTYLYRIYVGRERSPLRDNRCMHVTYDLDVSLMREALEMLIGEHDFKGFMTQGSSVKTTVRTIYHASIEENGDELHVYVGGSGFLYNMVRTIVGTLVDVGRGKRSLEDFRRLLDEGDISLKGAVAPACGLYLFRVKY